MWFSRKKALNLILKQLDGGKLAQKTFGDLKNFHTDHFYNINMHILGSPCTFLRDTSWVSLVLEIHLRPN